MLTLSLKIINHINKTNIIFNMLTYKLKNFSKKKKYKLNLYCYRYGDNY